MEKKQQQKENLDIFTVQTSSCDDVVLWFGDLWERTGTANVVSALPFIPFVLISWIGYDVCAYEQCRMFIWGRALKADCKKAP